MPATTAASLIVDLKSNDVNNIAVVSLIADDPNKIMQKLLGAWKSVGKNIAADVQGSLWEEIPDAIPHVDRVRWLWARIEPEPEPAWARAAGLPNAPHVMRAMHVLMENAAVFPDGTMSMWAEKFLVERARSVGVKRDDPPQ